jgi:hypothetical protein
MTTPTEPKQPAQADEEKKPEETKREGGFERVTEIPPAFRLDRDVFSDE